MINVRLSEFTGNVQEFIAQVKQDIETSAYKNRNTIYKQELREEIAKADRIAFFLPLLRDLRKTDERYDIRVKVDIKGYLSYIAYFFVTDEEREMASKRRAEKRAELGAWMFNVICPYGEVERDVIKDRVEKETFKGCHFFTYHEYTKHGYYVRSAEIY